MSPDDRRHASLAAATPALVHSSRLSPLASTPLAMTVESALDEGRRLMSICNACRYCEGYCAVFPALERRLEFSDADLRYLANLCHNCGQCLTSCQYAPPHEFALNLPRDLATIRGHSYCNYAWPAGWASMHGRGVGAWLALAGVLAAVFLLAALANGAQPRATFYDVIPHSVMAMTFGALGIFVVLARALMISRFSRDTGERESLIDSRAIPRAFHDAPT
jgi:citrate/tricarballylate utilization protein